MVEREEEKGEERNGGGSRRMKKGKDMGRGLMGMKMKGSDGWRSKERRGERKKESEEMIQEIRKGEEAYREEMEKREERDGGMRLGEMKGKVKGGMGG